MTNFPFSPTELSIRHIAGPATGDATLTAWDYSSGGAVRVANKSSNIAYIQIGLTAEANAATGMPVLPASVELFTVGRAIRTISTFAPASATLFFTQGQGGV